ncbi:MAG: fatty acid desaturase [Labilithrix sp.]|nr:fatty acid desaturase [Labilithrix sp.]
MRPRVIADYRAMLWVFGFMPLVAAVAFARPRLALPLMPLSIYLAYCAGVLAHNHNHRPVFSKHWENALYSGVISFFYGYPTFAWIPTHNENHHRHRNGPGDVTATSRHTSRNTAWAAFTFFFASARWQAPLIVRYLRRIARRSKRAFAWLLGQYALVFGGHAAACALAIALHGTRAGVVVYLSALGIPAGAALWGLMFTNYVQHVDCDPASPHDHSRNFVSPWLNFLLFDNGYHTVHHERPGLHWSELRAAHEAMSAKIDPRVVEPSFFRWCLDAYVLSARGASGREFSTSD